MLVISFVSKQVGQAFEPFTILDGDYYATITTLCESPLIPRGLKLDLSEQFIRTANFTGNPQRPMMMHFERMETAFVFSHATERVSGVIYCQARVAHFLR